MLAIGGHSLTGTSGARSGFFECDQYGAVRRRLPDDLKVVVTIAYTFGRRIKSEVLTPLTEVDLAAGTIRLESGQTKNDDGRIVYLTPESTALLREQVGRVKALMRFCGVVIPTSSRTCLPAMSDNPSGISYGRGGPPAKRPGVPGCSGTTSGARPCGTS